MIAAALVLGAIGILAALGLGIASIKLAVETDPRVDAVDAELPGANCGACGFTGCRVLAEAMVAGKAPANACIPGGAEVARRVAALLGIEAGAVEKKVAVVHCKGGREVAPDRGIYLGVADCRAAALVGGSPKRCAYGCMGLGSCVRSCPFDAIHVNASGIAEVDVERCTGCGACVKACPKGIIDLRGAEHVVHIRCMNPQAGKKVKAVCAVGCIGCKRCQKGCPVGAIEMKGDLAVIDPAKCVDCGLCAALCPTGNIDDPLGPRQAALIEAAKCIGCTKCAKVCPVEAVRGEKKAVHEVDPAKCIGCYRCIAACPKDAIGKGALLERGGKSQAGEEKA